MVSPSIEPGQKCLACGADATTNDGTVPLCSSCSKLAKKSKRGVEYEKPEEEKPEPVAE